MEEEFYSSIKLVTGEEVFALISTDEHEDEPIIIMQNPVIMKIINNSMGQYVKVKPWMELSNDEIYIIGLDKVVTMTEVKDEDLILFYHKYVDNIEEDKNIDNTGRVKLTDTLGLISSVDDARKTLENLYNLRDTKES
jgi:hypothetical protein